MKVLVSDKMSPKGIAVFAAFPEIKVDVKVGMKPDELAAVIGEYDGLAIRSATRVTPEIIAAADRLRVIGRAGIGVDNVDIEAATKRGIVVMNTPQGNTITTAEHTLSMMFALSRNIPQATRSMKDGKWEKGKFMGKELFNKTLGIVGLGNIGSIVADRALGMKMKVIVFDPFISDERASRMGIERVGLEELFRRADYITVHTPLTSETRHLINNDSFAKMKDGVRIINCARGGIINEDDLCAALQSGKVGGAAFDVFEQEPPAPDHPLLAQDTFICTPHLGASTDEAQENVAITVAEQIADYLLTGTITNALNVPSVSAEVLKVVGPYVSLAEKMGMFYSQLCEGDICGLTEIEVAYKGAVTEYDTSPITIALLKGLLRPMVGDMVNFVNASAIAKERGIAVTESKTSEAGNFSSMITLTGRNNSQSLTVSGTLFGKTEPRIVRVNEFDIEAIPAGTILVIYAHDKPGVIGGLGTFLGERGVNIGKMQFGRERPGGMSVSMVQIDSPIEPVMLKELLELPNVVSAREIYL
ncbi:MAG: phosphoglycerate dehydrogenase [Deltaproteobacteria bacterium]|nr:phosphoglycerate dehydrogenase [Candidatus Anaeroferrophillacea bacterium]